MGRPDRRTRPAGPSPHPADRHPRSTFFWRGVRVGDDHRSRLAATQGGAGRAPRAGTLVAVPGLVEDSPEGVGRDGGQAIGARTQGVSQGAQRPGGCPVGLGGRGPLDLIEDPSHVRLIIDGRPAAAMPRRQCGEALGVEASDEVRDGVAGTTADGMGRGLVVVAASDGQKEFRAGDLDGRSHLGAAELAEGLLLVRGQLTERVDLATGHGGLPGVTQAADCSSGRANMAMSKPNDPLAPGEWDPGKIAVATPIIDGKHAEDWIQILGSGDAIDRRRAVERLRDFAGSSDAAVTALARALRDPDAEVRLLSAHVLGEIGPKAKDAIPALVEAGEDELDSVREAAALALRKIDPATRAVEGGPVRDQGAPPVGKCP